MFQGLSLLLTVLVSLAVGYGVGRWRSSTGRVDSASETKFARIFRASPDAVTLSTRSDGRFREVNDGFTEVTGYTREQTLGKTSTDLQLWVKPDERQAMIQELANHGCVRDFETEFRHRSGCLLQCKIFAEHLVIEGEDYLLFVVRDITNRKHFEQERTRFIGELEAKNDELERFVYTVSHDLRSPLVTIQGFVGLLDKDIAAGKVDRVGRDLERIQRAADTLQQQLDELLELSRIGRVVNPPTAVPFQELVQEAVEMVAGPLEQRGVEVVVQDDLPVVQVDRIRLREVFQNLIENAAKFFEEGQEAPRVEIGLRQGKDVSSEPTYFVRDNGRGIEEKFHEKIFGLFERLDQSIPGTGIGLAVVRRIIEVHGGRIWVESDGPGTGSTFCFTLGKPTFPEDLAAG